LLVGVVAQSQGNITVLREAGVGRHVCM